MKVKKMEMSTKKMLIGVAALLLVGLLVADFAGANTTVGNYTKKLKLKLKGQKIGHSSETMEKINTALENKDYAAFKEILDSESGDRKSKMFDTITEENFDDKVEFCSIVSAKTGKCSENCKYCAQSAHYRTNIETHPLLSPEEVKKCALEAKQNGAKLVIITLSETPLDSMADLTIQFSIGESLSEAIEIVKNETKLRTK